MPGISALLDAARYDNYFVGISTHLEIIYLSLFSGLPVNQPVNVSTCVAVSVPLLEYVGVTATAPSETARSASTRRNSSSAAMGW